MPKLWLVSVSTNVLCILGPYFTVGFLDCLMDSHPVRPPRPPQDGLESLADSFQVEPSPGQSDSLSCGAVDIPTSPSCVSGSCNDVWWSQCENQEVVKRDISLVQDTRLASVIKHLFRTFCSSPDEGIFSLTVMMKHERLTLCCQYYYSSMTYNSNRFCWLILP